MKDLAQDPTTPMSGESTDAAAPRGGTVGRFVVLGTLGAGGMGVVMAAWDPLLDRKVALKLLRGEDSGDRLEREAQAMARLSHPNVAAVHEIGSVGAQRFVAMELVDGGTLKGWMATPRS